MIRRILFFPLALFRLILFSLYSLGYLLVIYFKVKTGSIQRQYAYDQMQHWAKKTLLILGIKLEYETGPLPDNCIVLSNHRSWIDPILIFSIYPASIIAKKEVNHWPVIHTSAKLFDFILVDRKNMKSQIQTMRKTDMLMKAGGRLVVFPEGTTSEAPGTIPFKKGTMAMAAQNNYQVIPMALEFEHRDMAWVGKELFIPHFLKTMGRPVNRVKMKIASPITSVDPTELAQTIKNWMDIELQGMRDEFDKIK